MNAPISTIISSFEDLELRRLIASVLNDKGCIDTVNILLYFAEKDITSIPQPVYEFFKEFSSGRKEKFVISNLIAEYQEKSLDAFLRDFKSNVRDWFDAKEIEIHREKLIYETKKDYKAFLNKLVKFISTKEELVVSNSYKDYLQQIISYLKDTKTAILLLGKAGSGKTALVKLLAHNLGNTEFKDYSVAVLDVNPEITDILKILSSENIIAFIDEAHRIDKDLMQNLKPLISETGLKLLLATTTDEAGELLKDDAFRRRLKIIKVEPNEEDVKTIMHLKYKDLETEVVDNTIKWVVNFSNNESPLSLADKILREFSAKGKNDLLTVVQHQFQINPDILRKPHFEAVLSFLRKRVLFQDSALEKITKWLTGYLTGFRRGRPLSFLFTGPTGTGKTLTAYVIAELIKGDRNALHVINMGNYQTEGDIWRLLGSAKGFVGSQEESPLRKIYRNDPFPVILFDEIEKAHPKIWDAFLSLTDRGEVEDNHGILNFKNSIIIFTSNAIANNSLLGFIESNKKVETKLLATFPPEFIGRLINIEFSYISREEISKLMEMKIEELLIDYKLSQVQKEKLKRKVLEKVRRFDYAGLGIRELERNIEETILDVYIEASNQS